MKHYPIIKNQPHIIHFTAFSDDTTPNNIANNHASDFSMVWLPGVKHRSKSPPTFAILRKSGDFRSSIAAVFCFYRRRKNELDKVKLIKLII